MSAEERIAQDEHYYHEPPAPNPHKYVPKTTHAKAAKKRRERARVARRRTETDEKVRVTKVNDKLDRLRQELLERRDRRGGTKLAATSSSAGPAATQSGERGGLGFHARPRPPWGRLRVRAYPGGRWCTGAPP